MADKEKELLDVSKICLRIPLRPKTKLRSLMKVSLAEIRLPERTGENDIISSFCVLRGPFHILSPVNTGNKKAAIARG